MKFATRSFPYIPDSWYHAAMATNETPEPNPKLRWYQYSLASLLKKQQGETGLFAVDA